MSLREAAQAALEAMEYVNEFDAPGSTFWEALDALRAALAESAMAEAEATKAEAVVNQELTTEPVDEDEVLFVFDAEMQGRHWWSGGTWLYPGDTVVVRRAVLAHGRKG